MGLVDSTIGSWITILSGAGMIAGLGLFVRGLRDYRAAVRVGDTATSTISSLAAGEVRIGGVVEAAELTLVSLLQSTPCVYYRSTIGGTDNAGQSRAESDEERSIGFRVRDTTGSIRVFPRGARIDAPVRFSDETGVMGDEPVGLAVRVGAATQPGEPDRAMAIANLLRVRGADRSTRPTALRANERGRTYREARLEIGDAVTIVGRALPFSDLNDPVAADHGSAADALDTDPEIAADLAEARAAGLLTTDPEAAWGNAAIPGFGIGRPVLTPELDPAADHLPLATPEEAARVARIFQIAPETLVLASSAEVPLLVAYGAPAAVMERSQSRYTVGLLGAVLAIASAMILASMINRGFEL